MDVRVPYLIQDPMTSLNEQLSKPTAGIILKNEPFFLDGPVTRRIAVLDFDETSGALLPGARFLPPPPNRKRGSYKIKDESEFTARDFMQVNVFATVLSTMYMYEEEDALGRQLRWAFDGPQLLVVPRAGEWANAFYERESRSLQFFYFPSVKEKGKTVYAALSQDIIAHETGHAILDGIAPDLYHSITPQSLALHEAIADVTSLLMTLRSRELVGRVLETTDGSISGTVAFSALAEEFGFERDITGRATHLRCLWNDKNLDPDDTSLDVLNQPNSVSRKNPHELSQVLSGALYRVLAFLHEEYKRERVGKTGESLFSASGFALFRAREHLKRLVLRALDYLPPGEVSFADYGRAILAADQASHPDDPVGRDRLTEEFCRRHIVSDGAELAVRTNFEYPGLEGFDLPSLISSDWAAYDFVNQQRDLFSIPRDVPFEVRPRLEVTKLYYLPGRTKRVKECIVKVAWSREEPNPQGIRLPERRQITVGTTLAIDWEQRRVRALLPSHAAVSRQESNSQENDRNALLQDQLRKGSVRFSSHGDGPPPGNVGMQIESNGGLMRVRGSGRLLHIAAEEND